MTALADASRAADIPFREIGDCATPRRARCAFTEGRKAALAL